MLEIVSNAIITKEDLYPMRVSLHNSSWPFSKLHDKHKHGSCFVYRASFVSKGNLIALIGLHEVSNHPGLFEKEQYCKLSFQKEVD